MRLILHMTLAAGVLLATLHASYAQEQTPELRNPSRSQIEDLDIAAPGATRGTVRPLAPPAPELIMDFEGWKPAPYDDPSGYCTVGYGHLLKKTSCGSLDLSAYPRPLTKPEGRVILEADTRTARSAVQRLVRVKLTDDEFGAVSAFVFNIGKDHFAQSTMLALLNEGDMRAASKEFGKWIVSKGKVWDGLVARRACEAALFRHQVTVDAAGAFARRDCTSRGAAPASGTLIDIDTGQEVQQSE